MLELDGSDGGGQLFRSALTLSALTGTPIEMEGIRGSRPERGLRSQHLAVLRTLADVCDASVEGAEVGATAVRFEPDDPTGGRYAATIETAGSLTLLFDAIVPLATAIDRPLRLAATGGTSVAWSPSMPWYRRVKLPLLRRLGVLAAVDVDRPGFYPAGGGQATLMVAPTTPERLSRRDRGPLERARVHSVATDDLANEVAERQADRAVERLAAADAPVVERTTRSVSAASTGTALLVALEYDTGVVGTDALGEPGKPAEDVADEAVEAAFDDHGTGATVDAHLADQLVPWLALAGGRVTIPRVTDHVRTHCELVGQFGFDVTIDDDGSGRTVLRSGGSDGRGD